MEKLILVVHLIIALAIIGMILLQQGKGAEAGASFGSGASQTFFGSTGTWNFFSRATAILATLFFASSLTLAVMARNNAGLGTIGLPAMDMLEAQNQKISEAEEIPSIDGGNSGGETNNNPGADYSNLGIPELDEIPSDTQ
jgi:preprotein translocase subunit SecG